MNPTHDPNYDPVQRTQDAVAFAQSRFGQHYLQSLQSAVEDAQKVAENLELSDSYRAHHATKAATLKTELDYFKTAQTIIETPTLLKKLKEGVQRRLNKGRDADGA